MQKIKKIIAECADVFNKKCKNCPIPLDKRYTKTSYYGYTIAYLEEYRRTMAAMNSVSGDCQHYSQTIFEKPQRVNTSLIPQSWKQIAIYKKKLQQERNVRIAAIAAVAAAVLLATISLGAATFAVIAASSWLRHVCKKIDELKDVKIPQAIDTYHHYAIELPLMQKHRDVLWKNKINNTATRLIEKISRKKEEAIRKESKAQRSVKQQMHNMELIIKTMNRMPKRHTNYAKIYSFI